MPEYSFGRGAVVWRLCDEFSLSVFSFPSIELFQI
jgi:hypothetical protein